MRLTLDELEAVKHQYGVSELWSWLKVETAINSLYSYYLRYVLHIPEDRTDCAYAPMGAICHSVIENFYSNKIKYNQMIDEFQDGWLSNIEIADLKFDRNNEEKNQSIGEKYKIALEHFFKHHQKIKEKVLLEQFITAKIGNNIFQGYIDAIYKDKEGSYHIIDWKTSTKYTGKAAEEKCGQLIVYAIGLNQKGIPLDKIKICWNFVKYTIVTYKQKNGNIKNQILERNAIGKGLQSNAKMWLKDYGYADKTDMYLKQLLDANDISVLPTEVQAHYTFSDCYIYVPVTQELVDKWIKIIISTINDIKLRLNDYNATHNEKAFWDSEEKVKAQSFYFATLCGYSPKLHKPYGEYLEKYEENKDNLNLFSGVGVDTDIVIKTSKNNTVNEDLSWLDEL